MASRSRSTTIWLILAAIGAGRLWFWPEVSGDADVSYNNYYDHSNGDSMSPPESGKKIKFPQGAKLIIKPSIEIPLLDDSVGPMWDFKTYESKFKFEMPVEIDLDKLGIFAIQKWMAWGNQYLDPYGPHFGLNKRFDGLNSVFSPRSTKKRVKSPRPNSSTPILRLLNLTQPQSQPQTQPHYYGHKYRPKRSITSSPTHLYDDRFHVLTKLEGMLESVGWAPGQACLQRTICELHEYFTSRGQTASAPGSYNFEGYGLVGEIALLLLSVSKTSTVTQEALQGHLNAERSGLAGNCSAYTQMCNKSVFS